MTVDARQILDEYLRALEEELRDLAPSDRAEIILEVREHFEDARRELADPTEADLRNIVERLGRPAEIAAEARRRLGVAVSPPDTSPPASATASNRGPLEIAALILWVLWFPLGVLLMALSSRWTRREKAMAIVVELGFFAILAGLTATPAYFAGRVAAMNHLGFLVLLLLFPPSIVAIPGAAYLTWKLASLGAWEWTPTWKIAGRTAAIIVSGWLLWVLVLGPLTLLVMKARGA